MPLDIDSFKAQLVGGGARANLFRVTVPFPSFAGVGGEAQKMSFMCKATSLPASTLGTIEIPYRGRKIKLPGDRTFEAWTVTVINDTDFLIRNAFERWSNAINQHRANTGLQNPAEYSVDAVVEQLSRDESVLKSYTMAGAFPTIISAIELSNETTDAIEDFVATLEYQYWTATTTS
jgi:hypothetical protein